jgi:hypothetical protein
MTITANMHGFSRITAYGGDSEPYAWLKIYGDRLGESVTVFMPYDPEQRIEATFNEWQREQDAAAEQAGAK